MILLQAYLGLAWTLGCVAFGLLVVHHSVECRIARQYLTQAAVFMCGLCILALTAVHGNYHGYVMFTWIYGELKNQLKINYSFNPYNTNLLNGVICRASTKENSYKSLAHGMYLPHI